MSKRTREKKFAKSQQSAKKEKIMSEENENKVPQPGLPKQPPFPVPEHSPNVDELQRMQKEKKREEENEGPVG